MSHASMHDANCPCTPCWELRWRQTANAKICDLQAENEALKQELEMVKDLLMAAISDGAAR